MLVAALVLIHYWSDIEKRAGVVITVVFAGGCLAVASAYGGAIGVWLESNLYHHRIIFSKQSKYQKIVVTERGAADGSSVRKALPRFSPDKGH